MITVRASQHADGFTFSLDIGQRMDAEAKEDVPAKVSITWEHMAPPDHVHEWMGPAYWLYVARILTGQPWQELDFRVVLMPEEREIIRFEGDRLYYEPVPTPEPAPMATARVLGGESQIVLLNKATGQEFPITDLVEAAGHLADAFTGFSGAFADAIGGVTPEDEDGGKVINLFNETDPEDD